MITRKRFENEKLTPRTDEPTDVLTITAYDAEVLRAHEMSYGFARFVHSLGYLAWITYSAPTVRGTIRGRGNVLGWAPLPPPSQTVPSPALGRLFDSLAAASRPG